MTGGLIIAMNRLPNLDRKLRAEMWERTRALHKRLGRQFSMRRKTRKRQRLWGNRLVVMKEGFVQQVGTPEELVPFAGQSICCRGLTGGPTDECDQC